MKRIALVVVMMMLGLVADAEAGRGGRSGGGSHSSRSHSTSSGTGSSSSSHAVRGYTRSSGTYVAPHHRTSADGTQRNNYSTKRNVNPYTGRAGTRQATH
jgi:hypothetical protein